MRRPVTAVVLALVALGGVAACGSGSSDDDKADKPEDTSSIEFRYTIGEQCLHPGERQAVNVTTDPNVNVGAAILYPDGIQRGKTPPQE